MLNTQDQNCIFLLRINILRKREIVFSKQIYL